MKFIGELTGEVFTETAQRLILYGCTEREAYALARITTLELTATDSEVEAAVIEALVSAKQSVDASQEADGVPEIEYVAGRRCDVQRRLEGQTMTKRKSVMWADELECQDSPVLAVLKHYGSPLTRDEYLAVSYLGEVDPDEEIPDDVEETWPEQFRRKTLLQTPPASDKVQ